MSSPTNFTLSKHIDASILALASSTDNFTVGFSIGIRRKHLGRWANALISLCNGLGAFLAVFGGRVIMEFLPSFANVVAALMFGVLGTVEIVSYCFNNGNETTTSSSVGAMTFAQVIQLSVPMTLNNLAGGAAGGAMGLSPGISGFYAVVASYVMMHFGHMAGYRLSSTKLPVDPSLVSGVLLLVLCLLTILDATEAD
ncbi:unnamed protein product [Cylindrotheca closterium]|uniref:Uncharacterized protein n=1 Tax=Cylindrotheca closterium TaxID=2856 RepID=A0AAD2G8L2_9STRA|nr:unnamed protein product [Cylindrotheca closterium]